MNPPQNRSSASRGFTLLEVILAMGMISIVALTLYQTLRIAFRARESATAAIWPVRGAHLAMDLVRREFEGTMPPKGLFAGPMVGYSENIGGDPIDSVEFYAVAADRGRYDDGTRGQSMTERNSANGLRPVNEGIRRVRLSVETLPDDGTRVLVRRVYDNLLSPTEIEVEPEILCRGVRSFSLRYFDGYDWQEDYDSTLWGDVLPVAIEAILEIERPNGRGEVMEQSVPYKVVRVFRLPCREEPVETGTTGFGFQ